MNKGAEYFLFTVSTLRTRYVTLEIWLFSSDAYFVFEVSEKTTNDISQTLYLRRFPTTN